MQLEDKDPRKKRLEAYGRARHQRLEKRPDKRSASDAMLLWAAFVTNNPKASDKWSKYAQFIGTIPTPRCGCLECSEEK